MSPDGKDMGEKMEIPGIGTWAKCVDTEENLFSLLQPSPDMTAAKQ
jgi:predicted enzyme related to lactoylglutathione lyase